MQALAERLALFTEGRALKKVELLGFSSLKTFSPPVEELYGQAVVSITRRAKYLVWAFSGGPRIVLHLSQAGRVDTEVPPKKTRPRGSVARFVFSGGSAEAPERAVLVREHGTQRKASWWILAPGDEGPLEGLGPEPDSEAFAELIRTSTSKRRLHSDLRDRHAGFAQHRGAGAPARRLDVGAGRGARTRAHPDWRAIGGQVGRTLRRTRKIRPALPEPRLSRQTAPGLV
jgi:formamidopyrimidine-DNA glycosylase